MTKRERQAYLAGAIDSDGTIGVRRSTYAMRVTKESGQATYSERVALRQVTPEIVDLLTSEFGGSNYITKSSTARGRPLFSWLATDLRAYECILAIRPFLKVKKAQADNCVALRKLKERSKIVRVARGRGHAGSAPRPAALTDAMEACYLKAKALNLVGVR